MTDRVLNDAHNLKKLIREAEALADESMIAFTRLKQAMLAARQNPAVEVHTGQRALMRLNQAEAQAMAMSTSLLRVHDELSKVAREKMGGDSSNIPTEVPEAAIGEAQATDALVEDA
ncbi:hypothetical protein IB285_00875 [Erythrobacter sp. KMU-140]|uniref:Phasin domain-containing protein n=2 Tax=Erythrobacter rubeus TaxID=2760803 RepID=A0ABR8KKJ7_9SPHN|nr:hypothetical protein [Erythrobacter rubeus]